MKSLVDQLAEQGFAIDRGFLTSEEVAILAADIRHLKSKGHFERAGVGQGTTHQMRDDIRRDERLWFEPSELTEGQNLLWMRLQSLKEEINRALFMGLWDYEGHYAIYSPGAFYRRHLDRFRSDDARTVSTVVYLNDSWQPGDGGELKLFLSSGEVLIEPRAGTLVTFMSDQIEHEVLESHITRMSFAGWFKRRTK